MMIGEVNETYERYMFNSRDQEADEFIDAYVAALRKSALTCNLCSCLHDSIIRDGIVLGVRSKQLRKRLLQERKRALSKCIDVCRSMEATSSQLQAISGTETEDVNTANQEARLAKQTRRASHKEIGKRIYFAEENMHSRKKNVRHGAQNA